jgi:hypothetical protein
MKTGMKRLRDGSIGRVPYVQPEGWGGMHSVLLELVDSNGWIQEARKFLNGLSVLGLEFSHDIVGVQGRTVATQGRERRIVYGSRCLCRIRLDSPGRRTMYKQLLQVDRPMCW